MEKTKKGFLILIPQELVEKIGRKLGVNPNLTLQQVETVTLWSIAEVLQSSVFIDYHLSKYDGKQIIADLEAQIPAMMKELKEEGK